MSKENKNTKQVLVIRRDLNMRKGKMVAQGAHAAMAILTKLIEYEEGSFDEKHNKSKWHINLPYIVNEWLENSYTKICVYVNSEAELKELYDKANEAGILTAWIVDNGTTEFNGVKTPTCIAIGPDYVEKIDKITKGLPLL